MTDEEIEKLFYANANPKLVRKLEHLKISKSFLSNLIELRTKWKDLISKAEFWDSVIQKDFSDIFDLDYIMKNKSTPPLSQERKEVLAIYMINELDFFNNKSFLDDIILLCKKHKIYPIKYWKYSIIIWVIYDSRTTPHFYFMSGLEKHLPISRIVNPPKNLNIGLEIATNPDTDELELKQHHFHNTSKREVVQSMPLISECQKIINDKNPIKEIRDYKNKELASKINELDKPLQRYEPTTDEFVEERIKDKDKIEILKGNSPKDKKEEIKERNRIRKIRQRDKERGV